MSLVEVGRIALVLATLSAGWATLAGLVGYRLRDVRWQESARGAAIGVAVALTAAVLVLEVQLVTGNFAVQAVFNHTNRALPLGYRLAALWGGDSGSVLFWGWILSLYTAYAAGIGWRRERQLSPLAVPLLTALLVFFGGMSTWVVNPFQLVPGHPVNGSGLDPLLQNPVMAIHPPAMYTGLIGMAVPFALFMSALWQRLPGRVWAPVVRRWLLFSWMFLSAAIVLGGWWAYMELGWGGYWEWDPVENASLLPWLTATAFLHALQVEEKRGMFRAWAAGLMGGSFLLTLVGTYITRGDVLKDSVHTFAGTGPVGPDFLALLIVAGVATTVVYWLRRDQLTDRAPLQDTLSREGILFLLAFVLCLMASVVLFGTFYPVISQAVTGTSSVLQIGFFDTMTVPLFIIIMSLMELAPVAGWRSTRLGHAVARLRGPWFVGLAAGALSYLWGAHTVGLVLAYTLAIFALAATLQEFWLAARVRKRVTGEPGFLALARAMAGNRRKFGGYLAHAAFLIIALGVAGSHTGNYTVTRTFVAGETLPVGPYRVTLLGLTTSDQGTYELTQADAVVRGPGVSHAVVSPGLEFFPGTTEPVAHVSILGGWWQDLYTVLMGYTPGGTKVTIQFFINPMVSWIWIGMYILVGSTLFILGPWDRLRWSWQETRAPRLVLRARRDEA
jgi:cytochrome c-type biogenesis protein CcmF